MLKRFQNISFKAPLIVVLAVACSTFAVSIFSYLSTSGELFHLAKQQLVALREARHAELTRYFEAIEKDVDLFARNPSVSTALGELQRAFARFDRGKRYEAEETLRGIFTSANAGGDRTRLKEVNLPTVFNYFRVHNRHHGALDSAAKLKGYYDIFLVTPSGDVVYSAFKEVDFASNLLSGKWSKTGLANAFRRAMTVQGMGISVFEDFAPYEPSAMAPAAFIAQKVVRNGRTIGAFVAQMPIGHINSIMQTTAGMGETGETYIVGADMLMRSDSRFSEVSTILKTKAETDAVGLALDGEGGVQVVADYRGIPVLSAYQPFRFKSTNWALLAEIDEAEVLAPVIALRNTLFFVSLALVAFVAAVGVFVTRTITRPLSTMTAAINEFRFSLSAVDLPQTSRNDEIGEIARGFEMASHEISDYIDDINEARVELQQGAEEIREREEQIRSLLEVSPIGFTLSRLTGDIIMTNPALFRTLRSPGGKEFAFKGEDIYRDPEDRKRYVELLRRDGAVTGFETQWRAVDGSTVWVTVSSKIVDYEGEPAILGWCDDITARKLAEREVAEKSAVLETTLENMSDGIIQLDADTALVLRNDRYVELIEGTPDQFPIGVTVRESVTRLAKQGYYGEGDLEEQIDRREQFFKSRTPQETELNLPSGRVLAVRHRPLDDGGCVAVFSDVTVQRRAQERLQSILDNVPGLLVVFDSKFQYIASNPAYDAAFNYPEGFLKPGVPIIELARDMAGRGFYGTGDVEELSQQRVEGLLAGRQATIELQGRFYYGGSTRTPDGGLIIAYSDMTEQKQAAEEVKAKEAQLRMSLDNMPGAMIVVNRDLKVVLVNDRYAEFYGDSDGQLKVGASMRDLLKSEIERGTVTGEGSPEEILEERLWSYRSGQTHYYEDVTPDGRQIQNTKMPAPGEHVISVAIDISEIKKAEAELAKQKEIVDTTLHNMDQGILMADVNLDLLAFNNRLSDLSGIPLEVIQSCRAFDELIERFVRDVLKLEDWESHVDRSMSTARSRDFIRYEAPYADGRIVEVRQNPLSAGGFVRTFTDITDRKEAERQLQDAFDVIRSSIQYASRIQRSILPNNEILSAVVSDYFILWEPRDVVGGDIYWTGTWGDGCLIVLGDCTGHGVPGAFMTLIAIGALERAMSEINGGDVGHLMTRMHQYIQLTLGQHQGDGETGDGLELGACYFVPDEPEMTFAAGRFDLFVVEGGDVTTIKGTKSGLGYRSISYTQEFDERRVAVATGRSYYMTSDGLIDQIGGERRRMFGKKRFKELLVRIQELPMQQQKEAVLDALENYQGDERRRDDVAAVGFRV